MSLMAVHALPCLAWIPLTKICQPLSINVTRMRSVSCIAEWLRGVLWRLLRLWWWRVRVSRPSYPFTCKFEKRWSPVCWSMAGWSMAWFDYRTARIIAKVSMNRTISPGHWWKLSRWELVWQAAFDFLLEKERILIKWKNSNKKSNRWVGVEGHLNELHCVW